MSPPAEEAAQQRGGGVGAGIRLALAFERQSGLLEILFPPAGKGAAREFGGGLLLAHALLLAGSGAANLPLLDSLGDPAHDGEVPVDPVAGGMEGEGGGQVK